MADADPVDITVRINDEFSGTIERLKEQLDSIEDVIEVVLKIQDSDIQVVEAKLQSLDGTRTESTHVINEKHGNSLDPPETRDFTMQPGTGDWFNRMDMFQNQNKSPDFSNDPWEDLLVKARKPLDNQGTTGSDTASARRKIREINRQAVKRGIEDATNRNVRQFAPGSVMNEPELGSNSGRPSGPRASMIRGGNLTNPFERQTLGRIERVKKRASNIDLPDLNRDTVRKLGGEFDRIDEKIKGLMPTMRKWMQLIAAILPMVIALGTAILGVATAMAAVGAAGAGMVGIGLLGFEDAEERIQSFKEELRTVFEPLIKAFKPITDQFLSQLPAMLSGVASEMQNLPVFKDTFFNAVETLIGSVEDLIQNFVALEPIISQLTERFTGMIASGIVEFLTWLVEEAYRNQDAMIDLGRIFAKIIAIIYKLSKTISALAIEFEPLLDIILAVAEGLQNNLVMGLMKSVAAVYALGKAFKALNAILQASALGRILSVAAIAITALSGFAGWSGNGGNAMGSGRQPTSSMPGSGTGDTYYVMNVEGDVQDRHISQYRNSSPEDYHEEQNARK